MPPSFTPAARQPDTTRCGRKTDRPATRRPENRPPVDGRPLARRTGQRILEHPLDPAPPAGFAPPDLPPRPPVPNAIPARRLPCCTGSPAAPRSADPPRFPQSPACQPMRPPPSSAACSTGPRSTASTPTNSPPPSKRSASFPITRCAIRSIARAVTPAARRSGSASSRPSRSRSVRSRSGRSSILPRPEHGRFRPAITSSPTADGFVSDSGAWLSRKSRPWRRTDPDCNRVALRRVREAVRFVRIARHERRRSPVPEEC